MSSWVQLRRQLMAQNLQIRAEKHFSTDTQYILLLPPQTTMSVYVFIFLTHGFYIQCILGENRVFFPYSALEEVLIVLRAATEGKIHKNFSKTTEIWLLWFYSFYAKTDIYSKNICL